MKLYDNIRSLCDKNGIKPAALARTLGFSKNYFTEMKSGRARSCSANKLAIIAEYFGISVDELLNGISDAESVTRVKILGTVPAGIPIDAIEDVIGYEEIDEKLASTGKFIALKIKGDSMSPQICSGDTVILKLQPDAGTGDTVVVMVGNEEATCKRLRKEREGVWLLPNNTAYEPMFYTNREIEELPLRVVGRVVELRRSF